MGACEDTRSSFSPSSICIACRSVASYVLASVRSCWRLISESRRARRRSPESTQLHMTWDLSSASTLVKEQRPARALRRAAYSSMDSSCRWRACRNRYISKSVFTGGSKWDDNPLLIFAKLSSSFSAASLGRTWFKNTVCVAGPMWWRRRVFFLSSDFTSVAAKKNSNPVSHVVHRFAHSTGSGSGWKCGTDVEVAIILVANVMFVYCVNVDCWLCGTMRIIRH